MKKMIANTMASIASLPSTIGKLTASMSNTTAITGTITTTVGSQHLFNGQSYNGGNYTTISNVTSAAAGIGGFTIGTVTANGNITGGPVTLTLGKSQIHTVNFKLDGNALPQGSKFSDCSDLFTIGTKLDGEINNQFHYQVWITTYGETFQDYGTVVRSDDGCYIAFGSLETKEHYLNWLDIYKTKFFADYEDLSEVALPKLKQGDVSGIYVPDNPDHTNASFNVFKAADIGTTEAWAWIAERCHSPVVRIEGGWIFKDASDAVLFKMR